MGILDELYQSNPGIVSRAVSFENPTGEPGQGGHAASPLGVGRKGSPARVIAAGETVILADLMGPGTMRHIWATLPPSAVALRGVIIRIFWEGQRFPSVELPLGEFFGFAHGATPPFQTALSSVGKQYGMNSFIPMPFLSRARVELVNETPKPITFFYQIDYTLGDAHAKDVGLLHAWFHRENPTTQRADFELLPMRSGRGRFLGAVIGVRPLDTPWWGEGEIKFFLDGDGEFATIVGTGSEDYVGLSWGIEQTPYLYQGANRVDQENATDSGRVSMYRWHVADPIYWNESLRVTMQQIGHRGGSQSIEEYMGNLYEREDDWSTATFWYSPDLAPLRAGADYALRVVDLA
jgi:hypothetical protein